MTTNHRSVTVVRIVALLHGGMVLVGTLFIATMVAIGIGADFENELPEAPYVGSLFCAFVSVNAALVTSLAISSWLLWKLRRAGLVLLCVVLGAELVYVVAIGVSGLSAAANSAAAAAGIGNMGLVPQMLLGYPVTGMIVVAVLGVFGVWGRAFSVQPAAAAARCA